MSDHKIAAPDHDTVKVTVRLPTAVYAEATRMARKRGVYVAQVISEALMCDAFLSDQEYEGKSILLAAKNGDLFKVDLKHSRGTRRAAGSRSGSGHQCRFFATGRFVPSRRRR